MPAIIPLLIQLIPFVATQAPQFIGFVKSLIDGADPADQQELIDQWTAVRAKVAAADKAWVDAGMPSA